MKTRFAIVLFVVAAGLALTSMLASAGLGGWAQVNPSGFGNAGNAAITALTVFDGQLYAGTASAAGGSAELWRSRDGLNWTAVVTPGFGITRNVGIDHMCVFANQLYAGTWADEILGGEIYRSRNGTDWTAVANRGFGDPNNAEIFRMTVYGGNLYASAMSYTGTHGAELWRSSSGNPNSWTRMVSNGFGDAKNGSINCFEAFNNYLYAGTWSTSTGGEVWRSSSGNAGTWTQVNQDGFGAPANHAVSALASFNGYLYAATGHDSGAGSQVWRCQTCSGGDWQKVADNGFGNPDTRGSPALEVYAARLYLVVGNRVTGMEVWRTQNGTAWERVVSGGFGNSHNVAPYWDNSVTVFQERLFVGTQNYAEGGQVWLYLPRQVYLPVVKRNHE